MEKALTLFDTTIAKKAALAISGAILFGWLLAHMAGNLTVFLGPEVYNGYALALKGNPPLLWGQRVVVAGSVIVHVSMMVLLYERSMKARPVAYQMKRNVATRYASATMRFTGPLLLLYLAFHIAHFTAPGLALGDYDFSATDVYSNFVNGFQVPWVTLLYVAANLALGLHLYHGGWSMLQSLGMNHPRYNLLRKKAAVALALVVTLGNISMPIAVLLGIIP